MKNLTIQTPYICPGRFILAIFLFYLLWSCYICGGRQNSVT